MKLKFETWVESTNYFSDESKSLLNEAIICYKVSAYRASYILSYLAFKTTLKHKILYSTIKPNYIDNKNWNEIKKNLDDEEGWENGLNPIIHETKGREKEKVQNVFCISDSLRRRCIFWKEVRNECAHAKNDSIDNSTVEMFWKFLEKNLSKFEIFGGKEYLIEKMLRAFQMRNEEESGESYKKLTERILQLYKEDEIHEFFTIIYEKIRKEYDFDYLEDLYGCENFWRSFLQSESIPIQQGMLSFIKSNIYIFVKFYKAFPEIFYKVVESDIEFKTITFKEWIFSYGHVFERANVYWSIIHKLCQFTPDGDLETFMDNIVLNGSMEYLPPKNLIDDLKLKGYYQACKRYLFNKDNILGKERDGFDFVKRYNNVEFLLDCLKNIDIDQNVVRKVTIITDMLSRKYNGDYYYLFCNEAYRSIRVFFESEKEILNKFVQISKENDIELSDFIDNLSK